MATAPPPVKPPVKPAAVGNATGPGPQELSAPVAESTKPARRKRTPPPENESKADKFKRLATYRVTATIKRLRSIAALANKSQYEYTQEQYDKINLALQAELKAISARFAGVKQADSGFTL